MIIPRASQPLTPLQTALYERMVADTELMGMLDGAKVYDEVPENAIHPYITLSDMIETPRNSHDRFGAETVVGLHIWSKYRGNAECLAIAARLRWLFDHRPLTVTGHVVIAVRHESTQTLDDPNPLIRHCPVRFRIITEQEI